MEFTEVQSINEIPEYNVHFPVYDEAPGSLQESVQLYRKRFGVDPVDVYKFDYYFYMRPPKKNHE